VRKAVSASRAVLSLTWHCQPARHLCRARRPGIASHAGVDRVYSGGHLGSLWHLSMDFSGVLNAGVRTSVV
jgi:hypothetical protein